MQGAALALGKIPNETVAQRQARYATLFGGASGIPRHWLYESAAATGRLLGPLTFEIANLYRAAGLETEWGAELPDHASQELTFLAFLAEEAEMDVPHADEWRVAERQFIQRHGGWLIQLGRALARSGDAVYRPIGAFLAAWLTEALSFSPSSSVRGKGLRLR